MRDDGEYKLERDEEQLINSVLLKPVVPRLNS